MWQDAISSTLEPIRNLEAMLVLVLERSEPQNFLAQQRKTSEEYTRLLQELYTCTTEADEIIVKAKLELCLILQYLYDMYTDTRLKAIVARYRELYVTHVENKLWRKKDMTPYEQTMPFDKPDVPDEDDGSVELPRALHRQYPGLSSDYSCANGGSRTPQI